MENSKDVKRRSQKSDKINRIVSLFEIPRPNRSKGLQRTNSLPLGKKPSITLGEEENKTIRSSLRSSKGGKVQKIKNDIEEKNKQEESSLPTNSLRKKDHFHTKKTDQHMLKTKDWLSDKEKIMEDINKLQEKIEDVTEEIGHSDTELEITLRNDEKDNFFEENSDNYDRLSSDTVFSRLSCETVKEVHEPEPADIEDNEEPSYTSLFALMNSQSIKEKYVRNDMESGRYFPKYDLISNSIHDCKSNSNKRNQKAEVFSDYDKSESQENADNMEVESIEWWKHKSFVQINNENLPESGESKQESSKDMTSNDSKKNSPILSGRFIKNYRSSTRNTRRDRRRTGVLKKPFSVKDLTNHFEGFKDAAENGETENFRKSFIFEMDKELENMKNDGFTDELNTGLENLNLTNNSDGIEVTYNNKIDDNLDELMTISVKDDSSLYHTIFVFPNSSEEENQNENILNQDQEDLFGEMYFTEDFENGLYYVEAFNADGEELLMCSVQVDKKSVDLQRFNEMKARVNTNLISNDNKTLVLMEAGEACSLNGSKSGDESKRNTIYSTTSGESYEDEDIDIENSPSPYSYSAARRETYCDYKGIPRIERVANYEEPEEPPDYVTTTNHYYESGDSAPVNADEENYYETIKLEHEIMFSVPEVKKETLQYILDEILCTEQKYVADMRKVLEHYKIFLEERCPEKVDVVFANMDQIYEKQLIFFNALESSENNVNAIVEAFLNFEDLFRLYPRYFKNTPKANAAVKELGFLLKEKQEKIHDKLDLSAYLLTPLQRIAKYKLFLENIIKQLEKEQRNIEMAQTALDMVKKYMSKGNDAVAIASILHSPLHTKDYGSFISREKFFMIKPKKLELMVFLFERVVVFALEDPKNMERFIYYQSITTDDLRIATFDNNTTIHLTDFTKTKRRNSSKYTYVLDAKSTKIKATWKQQIEEILWKQMMKIKENTIKAYQSENQLLKKPVRSREQRHKSTGSSTFYVE